MRRSLTAPLTALLVLAPLTAFAGTPVCDALSGAARTLATEVLGRPTRTTAATIRSPAA